MDAEAATDERGGRVRQKRVVPTPRCWRQASWSSPRGDGGKKAGHQGERAISRKAIAQGRSDCLRWTCMLVCALLVHIAHETAGAARIRPSLRPLISEGVIFQQNSGNTCRGIVMPCLPMLACRRKERRSWAVPRMPSAGDRFVEGPHPVSPFPRLDL